MRAFIFLLVLMPSAQALQINSYGPATRPVTTVAGLPTCGALTKGFIYFVTDALTPVAIATVVGGGAAQVGVTCNGTNWIVQ